MLSNSSTLFLFITTFFVVSITPGMCMLLSTMMGITIGVRKTMFMMVGELIGVSLVVIATLAGVALFILEYPELFWGLKIGGALYLSFLGIQLWRSKGKMALQDFNTSSMNVHPFALASQGFITAVSNPKGWVFFIALLPPFIDISRPIAQQGTIMLMIILTLETLCMFVYALGGKALRTLLLKSANVRLINRLASVMMIAIAIWLVLS